MTEHVFGGNWTDRKIELVRGYLDAYTTALKARPFRLIYVDAFAGTGYRSQRSRGPDLLAPRGQEGIQKLAKGSARVAMEIDDRPFDEYVFIEKRRARYEALTSLLDEFPERADRMRFLHGDANTEILKLCRNTNWTRSRAVMFLDPYGMQVEWRTVEAVARTRSIDLWFLFPVMAIVRMTPKSGEVPPAWQDRLDLALGDKGWRNVFYQPSGQPDLFGKTDLNKTTDVLTVERYLLDRLRTCFAGVAPRTWHLMHARQCMFVLAFAVGNPAPKAKNSAIRIAQYLIDETTP